MTEKDIERFWKRVNTSGECWEWTGSIRGGYGRFNLNGCNRLAHRISWIIVHGDISDDLFVCHRCDNRRCVRLDHLFLGTNVDNMADMVAKGRQATGERNAHRLYPDRYPQGEQVHTAKLTIELVQEIRARRDSQHITQQQLAREYGVARSTIGDILCGKCWKNA